jgi:hypothetical protein
MRLFVVILLTLVVLVAACQKAEEDPTPTPDQASFQAASTLFAQPTRATRPTPTVTPVNKVELDLNRTVARMEQAVLAGDKEAYLALVSDADPMFWNEHSLWAQDWVEHPLSVFTIELYSIQSDTPDRATARMTIRWGQRDRSYDGASGGSTVSAVFYRNGDTWLFGGENWHTLEVEGIRLHYFADDQLDNTWAANDVSEFLSDVYYGVTREFDFVPKDVAEIKMYDTGPTLQTMTRLSLPYLSHWNEPGESIKIAIGFGNNAPTAPEVARDYTRFVLYEMAGGTHGSFPWWLEEGIAEYGGSLFQTFSHNNRITKGVAVLALAPENAEEQLLAWDALGSRANWDDTSLQPLRNQVFTLLSYITETYGTSARNAWIRGMAGGQALDEATQEHLGVSFETLDAGWRTWLPAQL